MSLGEVEMAVGIAGGLGGLGTAAVIVTQEIKHKRPSTKAVIGAVLATAIGAGAAYDSPSRVTNEREASLLNTVLNQLTVNNVVPSEFENLNRALDQFCAFNKVKCVLDGKSTQDRYVAVNDAVKMSKDPAVQDRWIEELSVDKGILHHYLPRTDETKVTVGTMKFQPTPKI